MGLTTDMKGIEAVFLDLDGTIYLGNSLIDGASDFLTRLEERGVRRYFLSNNSSRSVAQYLSKLRSMGIIASEEEVLLSTHDLLRWLKSQSISETYLVGTRGMMEMLVSAGVCCESRAPQAVVLGYDTEISYEKLSVASEHLHSGVPLIASHPDIVCPSPVGGLPDVGAYLALFEATTGMKPSMICGKPNASMITGVLDEIGLDPGRCAMIGDRIYTDMAMAEASGVHGVLVLSGEASLEDAESSQFNIDLVVPSVHSLFN